MTRKRRRLYLVLGGLATLGVVSGLVLSAFSDNLVFFYGPSELMAKHIEGKRVRIGGLVENGSFARAADGKTVAFKVTDGKTDVAVTYGGIIPDLFREGQGVVIEGKLGANGQFRADEVLAKHDENYMPREVVDALKKSCHWQEGGAQAANAPAAAGARP
jgi:cytochrome c-type biogenesis protein CcmE